MRQNLIPILSFFLLAFALSWLANEFVSPLPVAHVDIKTILTGIGPALSGLLCYIFFRTPNTYHLSLSGTRHLVSYGITLIAIIGPLLIGQKISKTILIGSIITQFIYTLGEEFGWRHYLQNATSGFSKWGQALLIGVLWFLWHYSILSDPTTMLTGKAIPLYIGIPGLILLLTLLSQLFGSIVIRTQAVLFPVVIHYIGKVGPGPMALILIGLVLATHLFWKKLSTKSNSNTVRTI